MQELIDRLNGVCDEMPYQTNWYLKDLRTGEEADRDGHVVVPSASTRKIAILMTALAGVNDGRFTLDQPVTIQERYQISNSGTFQHFVPGSELKLRDMLVMMIIVSDNTSTGTIADMVGLDAVNALCQSIGMRGTTHRHGIPLNRTPRDHAVEDVNATTPADVGLLLDLILKGTQDAESASRLGCTPELCQLAIDILSWQKLAQRLPAHLPSGATVAHKTGTGVLGRNNNDAGIIFQDGEPRYIFTVYTEGLPAEMPDRPMSGFAAASDQIARMNRMCWDALAD
jgi:beta-lactamase class A